MIILRRLKLKDIPFMIEWMHDDECKTIFQKDFSEIDEEQTKEFIVHSYTNTNQNFAIVDELIDEYLGTISLKNIDYINGNAEYAISTRKIARGNGINKRATFLLINYAFNDLKLHKIYLNVLSANTRAINFYKKCGFKYEGIFKEHLFINNEFVDLEWYQITNNEDNADAKNI